MGRPAGPLVLVALAIGAAVAISRRARPHLKGRTVPGGILIGDAVAYDRHCRFLLAPLFDGIAADVATVAPEGAQVLDVGCGPGHLSIRLARQHSLDVTGLDLDPAMIERARANADDARSGDRRPSFLVGDVASLPFPGASFDLVVSTLSMHHWADPRAGLAEIGRVLRPGGRALIWDFRPGLPFHDHLPDPVEHSRGAPLVLLNATPWRWPWRFSLAQRIEFVRPDGSPGHSGQSGPLGGPPDG